MITEANIVRNKQGRVVGKIEYNTYIKEVYGHKHMLKKPVAWAIDCDIFDRVVRPLCHTIQVIDKDTLRKFTCGVGTFRENCHKLNRKFGDQYYLELIFWKVE